MDGNSTFVTQAADIAADLLQVSFQKVKGVKATAVKLLGVDI